MIAVLMKEMKYLTLVNSVNEAVDFVGKLGPRTASRCLIQQLPCSQFYICKDLNEIYYPSLNKRYLIDTPSFVFKWNG